jgi:uncharacterized protein YcbX
MSSATTSLVGTIAGLWRHPVKSFQGEPLAEAVVEVDGVLGDRCWGIRDLTTGRVLTARRETRLLGAAAVLDGEGLPVITLPDGTVLRGPSDLTDAALSGWLERPVALVAAVGETDARAEFFADATDDESLAIEWTMPPNRFVDALPLLVLTTASVRAVAASHPSGQWDVRRFRPNLFVDVTDDGWVEDAWCGRTVRIGEVELAPQQPCIRCTMVTRPQPGLERDLDIFRAVAREHRGELGVWTAVVVPGTIRVGDQVEVDSA